MDETHDIPETVTLRVGTTPIAGGDRYALVVEVEGYGHHPVATAPERGGMLFRRDSRERTGVVSEWKFGEGSGRVNVDVMPTIRMDGRDTFIGTITLAHACELLHVLRVLETGGWHLAGDAAMEARWNAGESLEPGDFAPAVVAEIPHAGPATPNATPETPHTEPETPHTTPETPHATPDAPVVTPEPVHADVVDPAHVEPSPVPTPAETPEMPEPFSPPQSGQ